MRNLQHTLVDFSAIKDGKLVDHLGHHQLKGEVVPLDVAKLVMSFRWDVADRDAAFVSGRLETALKGAVDVADDLQRQPVWQKPNLAKCSPCGCWFAVCETSNEVDKTAVADRAEELSVDSADISLIKHVDEDAIEGLANLQKLGEFCRLGTSLLLLAYAAIALECADTEYYARLQTFPRLINR